MASASPLDRADGSLRRVEVAGGTASRRRSCARITDDHTETQRECLDIIVGGLEEIVHLGIEELYVLKLARFRVSEVERGEPVVAVVALDLCRGTSRFCEILASSVDTEGVTAQDMVQMDRRAAWVYNGVCTADGECLAGKVEDSKGALVLGGGGGARKGRKDRNDT